MANMITFPLNNSTITVPSGRQFSLAVIGQDTIANKNKISKAVLLLNGKDTGIKGVIRRQPPGWVVTFLIKQASVGANDAYSVIVTDLAGDTTSTFKMQAAGATAIGRDAVSPGSGSTVAGSGFTVSYPYPGSGLAVSAYISGPTGTQQYGMQIEQQPDEVFYFQNVAPGSGYTITVIVYDNPPEYYYSNNITVT